MRVHKQALLNVLLKGFRREGCSSDRCPCFFLTKPQTRLDFDFYWLTLSNCHITPLPKCCIKLIPCSTVRYFCQGPVRLSQTHHAHLAILPSPVDGMYLVRACLHSDKVWLCSPGCQKTHRLSASDSRVL